LAIAPAVSAPERGLECRATRAGQSDAACRDGALADAEGERDDARRHSQDLRVLLDRVLREVDDLPEELRSAIEEALR
jgi:hypothetical protein